MIDIVSWPAGFYVPAAKLTSYVLDPASEDGASKGVYLGSYGYTANDAHKLRDALIAHAVIENLQGIRAAAWGLKFVFDGLLPGLNGRDATLVTVWQVDASNTDGRARFITTRPSRRKLKSR